MIEKKKWDKAYEETKPVAMVSYGLEGSVVLAEITKGDMDMGDLLGGMTEVYAQLLKDAANKLSDEKDKEKVIDGLLMNLKHELGLVNNDEFDEYSKSFSVEIDNKTDKLMDELKEKAQELIDNLGKDDQD